MRVASIAEGAKITTVLLLFILVGAENALYEVTMSRRVAKLEAATLVLQGEDYQIPLKWRNHIYNRVEGNTRLLERILDKLDEQCK